MGGGERNCQNLFCPIPSEKESTLKGKNLLSLFRGTGVLECEQEITKVISLVRNGGHSTKCIKSP